LGKQGTFVVPLAEDIGLSHLAGIPSFSFGVALLYGHWTSELGLFCDFPGLDCLRLGS